MRRRGMIVAVILGLLTCSAVSAETSELWGKDGERWSPTSRLPDYSFAGYHCGERPLPDVPAANDATKFGATANDDTDDAAAIQKAIDATENGAVTLPAGRFIVGAEIVIKKGNLVLRGAGAGKTILVIPRSIQQVRNTTDTFSFGEGFISVRGADGGRQFGAVAAPAAKGDKKLVVSDAAHLKVGDWMRMTMANHPELGKLLHAGLEPGEGTFREKKYFVDWAARVTAIDGNTISIDRPLRAEVKPQWQPQVWSFRPTIQELGIEGFTFEFPGPPKKEHTKEEGFNAIFLSSVTNSWVRDCEFIDADNGVNVTGVSRFCTFTKLTFRSVNRKNPAGHHAMWVRGSQDCLFSDWRVETEYVHDLSVEGISTGTVFMNGRGVALNFDHHRNLPYDNLFTDLETDDIRRLWNSGGAGNRGPHSGVGETFWNIRWTTGGPPKVPQFPMANVVGIRGMTEQKQPTEYGLSRSRTPSRRICMTRS